MSTRATIILKEKDKQDKFVYHHCDGYPEFVGVNFKKFIENYKGDFNQETIFNKVLEDGIPYLGYKSWMSDELIDKKDLSYEDGECIHGDESYLYVLNCDNKTFKCYKHSCDEYEDAIKEENEVEIPD